MRIAALALLAGLAPFAIQATPNSYGFSAGNAPGPGSDPGLVQLLDGLAVNGTFNYEADTALSGVITGGQLAGSSSYSGAVTDLFGSLVDAADASVYVFFDPVANAIVGDDKYQQLGPIPPPPADIVNLAADPPLTTGAPRNLAGFQVDGFTLVNVRIYWIEGTLGIPDFLTDQNLPQTLPRYPATLALDFTPTDSPGAILTVFFPDVTVRSAGTNSEVDIDIKPLNSANRIFPRFGLIPVAILGSETFDALQIDPSTLQFGPAGASALPWALEGRDLNRDGFSDLLVIFRASQAGIQCGDTAATLTGSTHFGDTFSGTDSITTIGCGRKSNP